VRKRADAASCRAGDGGGREVAACRSQKSFAFRAREGADKAVQRF
jgi:hypothetical protein